MRTGRMQIYTGNGKGKTTAALGLSIRAACSGMKVFFGQFMKGQEYSELAVPERFPEITMVQFGTPKLLCQGEKPSEEDLSKALDGASRIREAMISGSYDLVVADEICVTVHLGLLDERAALELQERRPADVELVFTGRYASQRMMEHADLVTEMKELKHYYSTEKLSARKGIES